MSTVKLLQREQLDVQAQAKILVTVAVVANLLLALVLSLLMFFGPVDSSPESADQDISDVGFLSDPGISEDAMSVELPPSSDW